MSTILKRFTSPSAQTLRTLQPTPSTIQYTVSTRTVADTIPAVLSHYFSIALRIIVGLATVLLAWAKCRTSFELPPTILQWTSNTAWEAHFLALAQRCHWRFLGPTSLFLLYLIFKRNYTEESLTLLRGLGIQTSTSSSTYLQSPTTRFIPTTSIQDIFIHEAFKGFEVRFYLAIVVEGEEDVVVVFPVLLPRREVLEVVWRGARGCLWEGRNVETRIREEEKTVKVGL
ncbi:hypothetical protein T440DRAFT_470279 [Plenodomus tracheiphilus IPT5]|uniref:Phosphatidylinositol N-acetylglucosaminyltransferase subunit H conserved domain-containing protein n=1 Tax=Plenodomus tracheiphilus IPT5 TaxID=1408161 RepID=A0A6A7AYQ8_9PLEO|nr:hypothetical protein T440DRAFT_470279 [Plenodomus tracheiphilus IPT5]